MVVEIPEMINLLEGFVTSYNHGIIVGGMVGSEIEKYVMDAALMVTDFSKILILNGCQDYIGLMKTSLPNVKYWGDIFFETTIDSAIPSDAFKSYYTNPAFEYYKFINTKMIVNYEFIIFFNTHLVDPWVVQSIMDNFNGQVIFVCDPFEKQMEHYVRFTEQGDIPIICDALRRVSPMIAMARAVYNQQSRSIDTRVSGNLTEIRRIQKKTIATKTVSHRQYITTDHNLYTEMIEWQKELPIRKNQSFIVAKDAIKSIYDDYGNTLVTLTKNSMVIAQDIEFQPYIKFRLFNSKSLYYCNISYESDLSLNRLFQVEVLPANILMLDDMKYHRFKQVTMIADRPLTRAERYTLFKNSNNVSIVDKKNMKGDV